MYCLALCGAQAYANPLKHNHMYIVMQLTQESNHSLLHLPPFKSVTCKFKMPMHWKFGFSQCTKDV